MQRARGFCFGSMRYQQRGLAQAICWTECVPAKATPLKLLIELLHYPIMNRLSGIPRDSPRIQVEAVNFIVRDTTNAMFVSKVRPLAMGRLESLNRFEPTL